MPILDLLLFFALFFILLFSLVLGAIKWFLICASVSQVTRLAVRSPPSQSPLNSSSAVGLTFFLFLEQKLLTRHS